jgi:hypothetical protein
MNPTLGCYKRRLGWNCSRVGRPGASIAFVAQETSTDSGWSFRRLFSKSKGKISLLVCMEGGCTSSRGRLSNPENSILPCFLGLENVSIDKLLLILGLVYFCKRSRPSWQSLRRELDYREQNNNQPDARFLGKWLGRAFSWASSTAIQRFIFVIAEWIWKTFPPIEPNSYTICFPLF